MNGNWRITFRFAGAAAEVVDYQHNQSRQSMIKNPVHPGAILQEDVLAPLELGVTQAAQRLGISRVTLSRILNGHSGIRAQVAMRLEKAGVGKAETWINAQAAYDLAKARQAGVANVRPLAA